MAERFGLYYLLKQLGSGAMGDAHLALPLGERAHLPSPLVIKRLHGRLASTVDYQRRFQHEAQIATRIDSPHVPHVYDVGRVGDVFYIAMEFIRGWPLNHIVDDLAQRGQRPTLESALDIVKDALKGLSALHSARDVNGAPLSAVHRDVSPKNLMVGEDGLTRVIDLGLGKSARQDWKTRTGAVMGTPGYMAPEQVLAREVDLRSDLYAVGVILWELLTGKTYIDRTTVQRMLVASVRPSFRAPSLVDRSAPPELDVVVRRALDLDPEQRFASADEFLAEIEAARPSDQRPPISSLIGQMLWKELADSTDEIDRLVEEARAADGPDTIPDPETLVISQRTEPGDIPTQMPETLPPTRILPPRSLATVPAPAPKPRRAPRLVGLAAMLASALLIGLWIGRTDRSPPPPPPAIDPPVTASADPRPVAAAIEAPLEPPPIETVRPPPKRPPKKPIAAAAVAPPPPSPPPPAAPADRCARRENESTKAWVDRLVDTAVSWRKRAIDEERKQQIDRIYSALARHQTSSRVEEESRSVEGLARSLAALEPN